jgi:chromate transporter
MAITISAPDTDAPATMARPRVTLLALLLAYLEVGVTAFSIAILPKLTAQVIKKRWMSEQEITDGLALVQLYPGPMMVDFTAYVGYKLRGVPGAVVATVSYLVPSFVLMLMLSIVYFNAGNLPWVAPMLLGLEALVVGVIAHMTLDFGARLLKGRVHALIALGAFAATLFKLDAVLLVVGSLVLGALLLRPRDEAPVARRLPPAGIRVWLSIAAVTLAVAGIAVFAASLGSEVGRVSLSFFKVGAIAFGNGITIMPLVQADVVDAYHWLTPSQFADGIAFGQITPGPVLILSTFVGYKMGGLFGALLATFAMFAPSFAMTLIFTEVFTRLGNLGLIRGALNGVMASFVGLLVVMTLQLGAAVHTPAALALAAAAFVAVRFFKLDVLWVFAGGLAVWAVAVAVGL